MNQFISKEYKNIEKLNLKITKKLLDHNGQNHPFFYGLWIKTLFKTRWCVTI